MKGGRDDDEWVALRASQDCYYNAVADTYQLSASSLVGRHVYYADLDGFASEARAVDKYLQAMLAPGQQVFEVGCGPSRLAGLSAGVSLCCMDASMPMLKRARSRQFGDRCVYIQARVENLPVRSEYFDLAVASFLFSHLPDSLAKSAAEQITRTLKRDAPLLIVDSKRPWNGARRDLVQQRRDPQNRLHRVLKVYREPDEIISLLPVGKIRQYAEYSYLSIVEWTR